MRAVAPLLLLLTAVSGFASAQQPRQSVRGVVRDAAGAPLGGAGVFLGARETLTDPQGLFRFDSVPPGRYAVTIRLPGFAPLRSRIAVLETEPAELEYLLTPAPLLLPTVVVEGRRTGIYGAVGDTGFRAAVGARVQVSGSQGGEALTDSMGRFAFPHADRGPYMVRVTYRGYTERRVLVEIKPGEGRELAVMLVPASGSESPGDGGAIQDLGSRLARGFERERLAGKDLTRYGSGGLCDVPRLRSEVGATTTLILNGQTVIPDFDVSSLCSWRADEVELVEFGRDVCRDVTQTLVHLLMTNLRTWCSGRTRNVPRSIMAGRGRITSQNAGTSYVVIWEKR